VRFFNGGLADGNRFVAMLVDHAAQAIAAIDYLDDALDHVGHDTIERMHTFAQEATERRRVLIDELHETFVTPLDREDIYNLAECYEKMVVYALTTLEEMHLLQVAADDLQALELNARARRQVGSPPILLVVLHIDGGDRSDPFPPEGQGTPELDTGLGGPRLQV